MTDEQLIDQLIVREGGAAYTNAPADRGGPTKYGITLRTLQTSRGRPVQAVDVEALTEAEARAIYRKNYLAPYAWIPYEGLRCAVVDSAVNTGPAETIKALQRALGVPVDGVVGPRTRAAIGAASGMLVLPAFIAYRIAYYCALVDAHPTQGVWLHGWVRRAVSCLEGL